MVYCCVRAKESQREACRGRALTDLSPPTNIQSRELRRQGSLDQVGHLGGDAIEDRDKDIIKDEDSVEQVLHRLGQEGRKCELAG